MKNQYRAARTLNLRGKGSTLRDHFRRLLGFAALPALSLLAPLVLLPLVASRYGAQGWSAVGLGQGLGAVAGAVVGLSWPITGGQRVARTPRHIQPLIWRKSLATRASTLVVICPLFAVLAMLIIPKYKLEAVVFLLGIALNGMTASWFYAGSENPKALVTNEGLVRIAGYCTAILGMFCGLGLLWYGAMTVAAGLLSMLLNDRSITRGETLAKGSWQFSRQDFAQELRGSLSRLAQAAFYFGAPSVYSLSAGITSSTFVGYDQVQKASGNALLALPQAFTGRAAWRYGQGAQTAKIILPLIAFFVFIFALWLAAAPSILSIMFSARLIINLPLLVLTGLAIALTALLRSLELLVLVPLGLAPTIFRTNLFGAVVGLFGLVFAAPSGPAFAISIQALVPALCLASHAVQIARRI